MGEPEAEYDLNEHELRMLEEARPRFSRHMLSCPATLKLFCSSGQG
ncbi:hypothetical protein OVA06_09805 [Pseudarthrobacter sp. SL88]|nr:hypothetical protein [Pseudarthrobacter sp. SL88]MCY1675000.1 hypothetical protein [Pseudarthrobacter sp. SL88]